MADIHESKPISEETPANVVSLEAAPVVEDAANLALTGNEGSPDAIIPALPDGPIEEGSAAAPVLSEPGKPPESPVQELTTQIESLPANKKMIALFVREEDLKALWDRSAKVRQDVITSISDAATAKDLLKHIDLARNALLAGKENYAQAESYVNEVEYRIAYSLRVQQQSSSLGLSLFVYETIWAFVLLAFLFLVLGPAAFSSAAIPSSRWSSPDVVFLLGSMVWGALGGVIGAWLSLVRHITKDQDFNRQHLLWYINAPVMGLGVGAVIFLIMRAGLLSITGPSEAISSPLVIYLLAWLSGFQQNVFTDMIRRLLQVFKIEGDGEEVEPTTVVHKPAEPASVEQPTNGRP